MYFRVGILSGDVQTWASGNHWATIVDNNQQISDENQL